MSARPQYRVRLTSDTGKTQLYSVDSLIVANTIAPKVKLTVEHVFMEGGKEPERLEVEIPAYALRSLLQSVTGA